VPAAAVLVEIWLSSLAHVHSSQVGLAIVLETLTLLVVHHGGSAAGRDCRFMPLVLAGYVFMVDPQHVPTVDSC
jgi:hypothetical protein